MEEIETCDLDQYHPAIKDFVINVLKDDSFSIVQENPTIYDAYSGCPHQLNQKDFDRFKLKIPYAGQSLTWEVIFDSTYPEEPPDIIFEPNDDDFQPPIENMETLSYWNAKDKNSLNALVKELLRHYRTHNNARATRYQRIEQDVQSLFKAIDLNSSDFELLVLGTEAKPGTVHMAIRLNLDLTDVPPYITAESPDEKDQVILCLSYQSPESSRVSSSLQPSPRVESVLTWFENFRVLSYKSGTELGDYVGHFLQTAESKISLVVQAFEKRKEIFSACLSYFGRAVIEYDIVEFSKMTFLYEWQNFFFTFTVELPDHFPHERPRVEFQSVYHEVNGKPYSEIFDDLPYSPRWSPEEMASRLKKYILAHIKQFQHSSVLKKSK